MVIISTADLLIRGPGRPEQIWQPFDDMEAAIIHRHIDWMESRNLRPTYVNGRATMLAKLRRALAVPLLAATDEQLAAWHAQLTISAASRATELVNVKAFYRWALSERLIDRDPTLRLARPRLPRRLPRPMPTDDVAKALTMAPVRVKSMLYLAAFAGLRACEIAVLEREDVLDDATPPVLIVRNGKGGRQRIVPLAPVLVDVLRTDDLPASGPLFLRADGAGHTSRDRICQTANNYLAALSIDSRLHTLRHYFATTIYRNTLDLRLTQELLGHASPTTTALYAAWSPERGADAVARLSVPEPAQ